MKRPAMLCGQTTQRGGNWLDQPDLPPGPLRTDRAADVIDAGRLNSEDQNLKRPKTNQQQRIKRQENTNRRSHHETSHTENRTATINPTPKSSFRRFLKESIGSGRHRSRLGVRRLCGRDHSSSDSRLASFGLCDRALPGRLHRATSTSEYAGWIFSSGALAGVAGWNGDAISRRASRRSGVEGPGFVWLNAGGVRPV